MTRLDGWIGVDLDGTLAEHYWPHKGEYEPTRIGDPIEPMVNCIQGWLARGIEVKIFTARVGKCGSAAHTAEQENITDIHAAIYEWTEKHIGVGLEATCEKNYAMMQLWDDRAVRVIHNKGIPCCGEFNG